MDDFEWSFSLSKCSFYRCAGISKGYVLEPELTIFAQDEPGLVAVCQGGCCGPGGRGAWGEFSRREFREGSEGVSSERVLLEHLKDVILSFVSMIDTNEA